MIILRSMIATQHAIENIYKFYTVFFVLRIHRLFDIMFLRQYFIFLTVVLTVGIRLSLAYLK